MYAADQFSWNWVYLLSAAELLSLFSRNCLSSKITFSKTYAESLALMALWYGRGFRRPLIWCGHGCPDDIGATKVSFRWYLLQTRNKTIITMANILLTLIKLLFKLSVVISSTYLTCQGCYIKHGPLLSVHHWVELQNNVYKNLTEKSPIWMDWSARRIQDACLLTITRILQNAYLMK